MSARLVDLEVVRLDEAQVGDDAVAVFEEHQVAGDHLFRRHVERLAVAHHARGRRGHAAQRVQRPLGLALLHEAERGVDHDDGEDGDRVAEALHERRRRQRGEQAEPGGDGGGADERQHREVGDLRHHLAPDRLWRLLGQAVAPDADEPLVRFGGGDARPSDRIASRPRPPRRWRDARPAAGVPSMVRVRAHALRPPSSFNTCCSAGAYWLHHRSSWSRQRRRPHVTVKEFARQFMESFGRNQPFDLAAQLAYFAILSIFPFAMFLLTLVGFIPLHGLDQQILSAIYSVMPTRSGASCASRRCTRSSASSAAGCSGRRSLFALWTASGGASGLITALNRAYDVSETRAGVAGQAARAGGHARRRARHHRGDRGDADRARDRAPHLGLLRLRRRVRRALGATCAGRWPCSP